MKFRVLRFQTLGSTSDYLKENVSSLPSGALALAEIQTKGRGRMGRQWESDGRSLTFSFLLKGERFHGELPLLPFAAGEAVASSIEELGLGASLKWPNDVYLDGRKAAGILVESLFEGNAFLGAIVGIGVNLNQESFPLSLPFATSLRLEKGEEIDKESFFQRTLGNLESILEDPASSLGYFRARDFLKGKRVSLNYYGENLVGTARGIDGQGRLLLEKENGAIEAVSSGEATLHPQE